jgi:hypothetical protein
MRATDYLADKKLTTVLAAESYPTVRWLKEMNVKWRLSGKKRATPSRWEKRFGFQLVV